MTRLVTLTCLVAMLAGGYRTCPTMSLLPGCRVIASFKEVYRLGTPMTAGQDDVMWHGRALVIKNGPRSGCLAPATLLVMAGPDGERLTPRSLLSRVRLAAPCNDADVSGRWLFNEPHNMSVFVLTYDCGGTAGLSVLAYSHWVMTNPDAQEHVFFELLNENSRLPVYVADYDGDGAKDLMIASEAANMSGSKDTLATYRVVAFRGRGASVIADEVPENAVLQLAGIEPF